MQAEIAPAAKKAAHSGLLHVGGFPLICARPNPFGHITNIMCRSYTQKQPTGELLFTSQTVYSRYERGALTIPVEHLLILADLYGVSTDYILGRTNNKKTK